MISFSWINAKTSLETNFIMVIMVIFNYQIIIWMLQLKYS